MSRRPAFERIPETPPHRPRLPPAAAALGTACRGRASRRLRVHGARHGLAGFVPENRYQAQLRDLALAMLRYMERHWCEPGHEYDFERWWRIADYYARALAWPELAGPLAYRTLEKILDQNQIRPSKL